MKLSNAIVLGWLFCVDRLQHPHPSNEINCNNKTEKRAKTTSPNVTHNLPETTFKQFCLLGLVVYLSKLVESTRHWNIFKQQNVNFYHPRFLSTSSNVPTTLELCNSSLLHPKYDNKTKFVFRDDRLPNVFGQIVIINNSNTKVGSTKSYNAHTINLLHGLADSMVSPVGSTIERHVTNALQNGIRQVTKQRRFMKGSHLVEQTLKRRAGVYTERIGGRFIVSSTKARSVLALQAGVTRKSGTLFVVSSVVKNVVTRNSPTKKVHRVILRRGVTSLAAKKVVTPKITAGIAKHSTERLLFNQRTTKRVADHSMKLIERKVGSSATRIVKTKQFRIPVNLALRIGNGCLVAVPVIGGLFSLSLTRQDIVRVQEELKRKSLIPAILFIITAITDFIDALIHFFISFTIYTKRHFDKMNLIDYISSVCMILSIISMILAEIIVWVKNHREVKNSDTQQAIPSNITQLPSVCSSG